MTKNQLQYWANQETARSNQAREAETRRYNTQYLAELYRHNKATEDLGLTEADIKRMSTLLQNELGTGNLQELVRSNLANERLRQNSTALGYAQLGETIRSNRANENNNLLALNETNRHNQILEHTSKMDANTRRFSQENEAKRTEQNQESIDNKLLNDSINSLLKVLQIYLNL